MIEEHEELYKKSINELRIKNKLRRAYDEYWNKIQSKGILGDLLPIFLIFPAIQILGIFFFDNYLSETIFFHAKEQLFFLDIIHSFDKLKATMVISEVRDYFLLLSFFYIFGAAFTTYRNTNNLKYLGIVLLSIPLVLIAYLQGFSFIALWGVLVTMSFFLSVGAVFFFICFFYHIMTDIFENKDKEIKKKLSFYFISPKKIKKRAKVYYKKAIKAEEVYNNRIKEIDKIESDIILDGDLMKTIIKSKLDEHKNILHKFEVKFNEDQKEKKYENMYEKQFENIQIENQ